jgi:stage 0 sporulation protein B (sporulation initiation phosphotransferase)
MEVLPRRRLKKAMKKSVRTRWIAAILAMYCLVMGMYSTYTAEWTILFGLLLPAVAVLWLWLGPDQRSNDSDNVVLERRGRDVNDEQRLCLQALSYQRHDFMNDIQVIFGYLRMNKYDKILEFVENMKHKAERDSSISRLGAPELSLYLYSFRARHPIIDFEVELDQAVSLNELPIDTEAIGRMAIDLMEAIVREAKRNEDGLEKLALEMYTEEQCLYICFELYGTSGEGQWEDTVLQAIRSYQAVFVVQADIRIDDQWATIEVAVPFKEQPVSTSVSA